MSVIKGSSRKGNSISGGDNSDISATAKVRKLNPIDAEYGDQDVE